MNKPDSSWTGILCLREVKNDWLVIEEQTIHFSIPCTCCRASLNRRMQRVSMDFTSLFVLEPLLFKQIQAIFCVLRNKGESLTASQWIPFVWRIKLGILELCHESWNSYHAEFNCCNLELLWTDCYRNLATCWFKTIRRALLSQRTGLTCSMEYHKPFVMAIHGYGTSLPP